MLIKCFLGLLLPYALAFPKKIHIGGLFDDDQIIQRTFEIAVRAVNRERHENPDLANVFLMPNIIDVTTDPLDVANNVCYLFNIGVVAIFGLQNKATSEHVRSMCDMVEIPYIAARFDTHPIRGKMINLYPDTEMLAKLYYELVREFKWKTYAILYENSDSLARLHLLLKQRKARQIEPFVFPLGDGPNYRKVIQSLKDSGIENIIIDASIDILEDVLKQALQVGILSHKHRVIVTSLDLQTLDLEPYQYSGVNFTGIRMIDTEDLTVQGIFDQHKTEWGLSSPAELRIEAALMYDAVQLFTRGFKQLKDAIKGDVRKLPCNGSQNWEHGISLSNFIRVSEMKGLTGRIKFDTAGFRSNFHVDIMRLNENGLKKIGEWSTLDSLSWTPPSYSPTVDKELSLQNKTFIVLISLTHPYGMLKESASIMTGNDRYEGFAVDIIKKLGDLLGFNYTFQVQADNNYGTFSNKTKKWNGMLRKIIDGEVDLAITDLTITAERESAVDFTMPFMNLGISILYKKPSKAPPSLFSFASPFSHEVWLYLMISYTSVSLLVFVIGRICPAEWNNPYPCIEEPETLTNQFTLKNSFWFIAGAIMQQGSEIAPIGVSTRMIAVSWWFFCLIMVSSYTANLAAFLTVEPKIPVFSDVEGLAKKKGSVKYGAKIGGSTMNFFQESTHSTYNEMYDYMMEHADELLTPDNEAGIKKVMNENYAFLMESSSIEYITERECNLTQIGGLLDHKGYGIAMKKNSIYRHELNKAVLKLSEAGLLTTLKDTWWKRNRGGGNCHDEDKAGDIKELDLSNLGGVFVVLTAGVAFSIFYTMCELIGHIRQQCSKENIPFREKLVEEIAFIMRCNGTTKPVKRKRSSSRSTIDSTSGCTPPYGFVNQVDDK